MEPEQVLILRDLHCRGETLAKIADRLNCSVATVSQVAVVNGLRRKQTLSEEQKSEIQKLADAYPVREIARLVQCFPITAGYYVIYWRNAKPNDAASFPRVVEHAQKMPKTWSNHYLAMRGMRRRIGRKNETMNDD